uniref:Transcription factor Gf.BMR1 n=1 Tax=Grifola frondosa TaxID=5627 RepID=U6C5J1_GRIFR|nr:transcription factor Gf.BMR1 [Grifola frondosa]
MAGDHKCPVCQSTFTRPQHVARHMRSHTGDRPYKCQHCGDQFARSDLLSRHVNKCHASEKPPTTTAPSRRKGAAAASRATTSKQACDQCVQSSLPCDGANPCSKCVQRKCRCTYVKFHRQTAPQGPGHPAPDAPQMQQTRHPMPIPGARLPDDFLLAPPPGPVNFPSIYTANPTAQFALPPQSSMYAQEYTHAHAGPLRESPSPSLAMSARHSMGSSPDIMARYRAQAELLSHAGVLPNGSLTLAHPVPSADNSGVLPGLYSAPDTHVHDQFTRYTLPPPSAWDPHMSQSFPPHRKDYDPYATGRPQHSFPGTGGVADTSLPHAHGAPPYASGDGYHTLAGGLAATYGQHPQRGEELSDEFGSDGSTSHSMPSSTNSSTVHLPLPHAEPCPQPQPPTPEYEFPHGTGARDAHAEGGFSSAFGLMSLDDPNVLAGLAGDGAPFFSGMPAYSSVNGTHLNVMSMTTPTQDAIAQMKGAAGREARETREMREFWKMYLRTPLSGPVSAHGGASAGTVLPLMTPTGPGQALGAGRPSPSRRHSRVASLPSLKTPQVLAGSDGHRFNLAFNPSNRRHHDAGGFSSARMALHDAEDLKSYEQAVLARKAPMTLHLQPKRKTALDTPPGKSKSMSPVVPHSEPAPAQGVGTGSGSRPSSGHAQSSSLAHAFGGADGAEAGCRPSFKRIASQTLGPENAKRALLGPAGWEDEGREDEDEDEDEEEGARMMAGLPDRSRRMSCPTTGPMQVYPG